MNYYNEIDPKAAAWLRELIKQGHIPNGHVDERSIKDVKPSDLTEFTQCHFFCGIGGWSRALKLAEWPEDRPVWTGSCPCQPFSAAGEGKGFEDERHLWPIWFNQLVSVCRPPIVIGEQVASKAALLWLDGVFADLEGAGYSCGALDLCAAGAGEVAEGWILRGDSVSIEPTLVGSPNIRQRLFWMANARYEQSGWTAASGQTERRGPLGNATGCSAISGLGNAKCPERWSLNSSCGDGGRDMLPQGDKSSDRAGSSSADDISRLVNSDGGQCRDGNLQRGGQHGQQPEDGRAGGVGNADSTRLEERGRERRDDAAECATAERAGSKSFWSAFDLLPCTDGKARRVESGSFPLAHGVPGRVGLLRGYGNAINVEIAAQFLRSCDEALCL